MPLAGIVTLIAVGLVVAALAIYLIWVAVLLRAVSFNLGTIIAGVRAIAFQTQPLAQRFRQINTNLGAGQQTLHQFVEELQRQRSASAPEGGAAAGGGDTGDTGSDAAGAGVPSPATPPPATGSMSHRPSGRGQ